MLPHFDDLPLEKTGPPYNAWGLWGQDDELGRLNLITPEAVLRGQRAIKHGRVINLNLPLDVLPMSSSRERLKHEMWVLGERADPESRKSSSQWDGLRHYPYQHWPSQGEYRYYGGMTSKDATDPKLAKNGTHNYVKRPITSAAHLLDIPRFLRHANLPPLSTLDSSTPITLDMLKGCAELQGSVFKPGDILVVHTGWTTDMMALSDQEKLPRRDGSTGVARGEDILRWHWDNGFSAVVSDVRAYESFPHDQDGLSLHEVFLAGWGMPIGELFDLRELAKACDELSQWTFLLTSMPLYVIGGIASPPNAQAIL